MKIAQVITRMDRGGSPDIVRVLCLELSRIAEVYLITGETRHPGEKTQVLFERFKNNIIKVPNLGRNINPFRDLIALIGLFFIIRKYKFDVVHTNTAKAGFLGRIAAKLAGAKVIVHTPHGHNFYGYFNPFLSRMIIFLERIAALFADRIIVLTELEKKDMLKEKIGGVEQIVVIPTGLELNAYYKSSGESKRMIRKGLGIHADELLVGMIGRLEYVKGPDFFIEAASIIAEKYENVKFLMVGEGPLKNDLERQMKKLGLENKMIFTGWRENVPDILSVLDVLVLPSRNEAVGNVLIEAGASSVPAVAFRVGGVPEIIEDKVTGFLAGREDPSSLAFAVIRLLKDEKLRIEMGQAAYKRVFERYNSKKLAENVYNLYLKVYAEKN